MTDAPDQSGPRGERESVLAATDALFPVVVKTVADDRTPEGLECLGTFISDRLVARCVVDPEAIELIERHGIFNAPVRLVLTAVEAPPGVQGRLFALVPMPPPEEDDEEEEEEPWADSVPGAGYEQSIRESEPHGERIAAFFLGEIVRFDRDRRHRESLAQETVDMLTRIVEGEVSEIVDKVLDDLLG